jgi:oxygen-independent coproporphyrinogen-3 oxidase
MNPESASEEVLEAYFREGARRLSFGMQSAIDEELSLLGRLHTAKETELAVKRARKVGFDNISLDLMYGLPNQREADFRYSLQTALSFSPKHISFYLLTLSEEVPLYQKIDLIPEEEVLRNMYLGTSECLRQSGFEHYEISNAALPGFRSRHNERYWKGEAYLGFGPGAHSYFGGERFSIRNSLSDFLSQDISNLIENREVITPEEERIETLMLSLRRKEGIDFERLSKFADEAFLEFVKEKMLLWKKHGLCRKTENGFALTPEGFFVSNQIISELI